MATLAQRALVLARRHWRIATLSCFAAAEAFWYWRHLRLVRKLSAPSRCNLSSTPEYRDWLRASMARDPDLASLVRGIFFNSCTLQDIPRAAVMQFASHLLFFGPMGAETPPQQVEEVLALLRSWERQIGVQFTDDDADGTSLDDALPGDPGRDRVRQRPRADAAPRVEFLEPVRLQRLGRFDRAPSQ